MGAPIMDYIVLNSTPRRQILLKYEPIISVGIFAPSTHCHFLNPSTSSLYSKAVNMVLQHFSVRWSLFVESAITCKNITLIFPTLFSPPFVSTSLLFSGGRFKVELVITHPKYPLQKKKTKGDVYGQSWQLQKSSWNSLDNHTIHVCTHEDFVDLYP